MPSDSGVKLPPATHTRRTVEQTITFPLVEESTIPTLAVERAKINRN